MVWDKTDERDWRVTGSWNWTPKKECHSVANHHGVYILADSRLQVKYVGLVTQQNLGKQLEQIFQRREGYGTSRVKVLYTQDEDQAYSLKLSLEGKYDPPNNQDIRTQRLRSSLRKYSNHSENWLAPLYFTTPIN